MVGKRKIENLRANIAKMARAAETNNLEDYNAACSEVPNLLANRDRLVAEGLTILYHITGRTPDSVYLATI